ncbi:hypothetical protein HK104_003688 [Borealophlyctis nickersoniae]|nr:hypothetical protein HK104_003688 [Borealophlyctis nickersoniae]
MKLPANLSLYRLSEDEQLLHKALRPNKRKLKDWNTGDIPVAFDDVTKEVKSVLEHGCRFGFSTWDNIDKCIRAKYDGKLRMAGKEMKVYLWCLEENTLLHEGLVPKRDEREQKEGHFALGAANREPYPDFLPRLVANWVMKETRKLTWEADGKVVIHSD